MANFKNGVFRNGSSLGSGSAIGKAKDYSIKGAEYMDEAAKVACYHFLVKKYFKNKYIAD